jgi:predicted transcriptional regulator
MLKKTRGRMEIVDKLSSDTPGIFEDWYKAHEKTIDQQPFSLKSLWERMPTNVIKLSIIFAAIDGAQTITYRHLNAAQTYADTLLSRLKKLSYKLATSDEDRNIKVVYEIIKGYKNIRRSDLIRKSSMTSKTLDIYVDTLLDSKLITKNRVDTGRKPATEYRITEY